MPVDVANAPTAAQGYVNDAAWLPSWGILAGEDLEENDLLKWPMNIKSYSKMMTDPQVQGLKFGSTWPIFRMRWFIESGDADAEHVERVSRDYGLPIDDDDMPLRRSRGRFKFLEHLEQALEAVFFGFQVFEQEFRYDDPAGGGDGFLHLRKLLNLPLSSITDIQQAADGGIEWIKQLGFEQPEIPMDRLVWYAFQKRGASWRGKSILRGCYGPWLLKDRAVRVGVMNIQRAGVGVPTAEAPPGATDVELAMINRILERFKGSERSSATFPAGTKFRLVGVEGNQPDAAGFVKLMNEEMARAFLQMFMMAGQTGTGTRATADTHLDFMKMTLEYIANWYAQIFNEHVIEDDWDWNLGEEVEEVPRLGWEWDEQGTDTNDAGPEAAANPAAELQRQIANGEVQVDDQTAAVVGAQARPQTSRRSAGARRRGGAPARAAGTRSSGQPPVPLPGRTLRRQPYPHEIAAAVDYASLDSTYQNALDLLVQEVRQLQRYQVGELHDLIVEAGGDMAALGSIEATPEHRDVINGRLRQVAQLAAEQHVGEAERQGHPADRPDVSDLEAGLLNRAEAVDNILTRDLSTSAGRNAVRLSGGSLTAAEVADAVRDDLLGRSDAYLRDVLGGAVQQAINDGRGLVMRRTNPAHIYASELLDNNTCVNCVARDGTQYMNMEDAARDYPSGGYRDCLGRDRCRGVLVAVYEETPPTFQEPFGP